MTVSSSSSRISYTGNGSTTAFAFPYEFDAGSDLKVYKAGTPQTITTHYTVSGGSGSSGTVTFVTAPASGDSVVIYDDPPATQLLDYIPNDPFPAESHEGGLDKLTRLVRRLKDRIDRAMRLSDSDVSGASTVLPTPSAQKILGWNAAANALVNYSASDLTTVAAFAAWAHQRFSGDGSTTQFTLASDPGNVSNLDVSIGGVTQVNGTDFTLSGTTLTFTSAPPSGTNNIFVRYGQALPQGTSALETYLASTTNVTEGDAMVGVKRTAVAAVAQTLHTWIEKQVLFITDFGAVADSGTTDNAAAINAACTAARLIGTGAAVYVPAQSGYFGVASGIDVSGVHMFGAGNASIIRANSSQFDVLTTTVQTRLDHFQVHGGWDGSTAGLSGDSISVKATAPAYPYDVHIDSVRILNSKKRGIYIERGGYSSISRVKCNASGLHGLEMYGASGADTTTTVVVDKSSVFSDCPNGRSVKITNGNNITLDGVISEFTQGYELAGNDGRNISINRCYQENTTGAFVTFTGSGAGLEMLGNFGIGLSITPTANWTQVIIGGDNTFGLAAGAVPADWKIVRSTALTSVTGSELTTSATGGTNFTATQIDIPPGIWMIQATLQTLNSVGATLVNAGFRLTNNAANNVAQTTGGGFVADEVVVAPSDTSARSRASMTMIYENATSGNETLYMRGYINISAGTIAYKGFMRVARIG